MKYFRKLAAAAGLAACLAGGVFFCAASSQSLWTNTRAGTEIESALFRTMSLPGGPVPARRLPGEAVEQISALVKQSPQRGELFAIRAQEEERGLEQQAAENDWKKAAELAGDKGLALRDLADFYNRRLEPQQEVDTLIQAGRTATSGLDRYLPDTAQPAWGAFERAVRVCNEAALPAFVRDRVYQAWIERYARSPTPYRIYLAVLTQSKAQQAARSLQSRIAAQFPDDPALGIETEAQVASMTGGAAAELAVYRERFNPLWPAELRTRYYQLLKQAHQLRAYLGEARQAALKNPTALDPALRLFFYFEEEGKRDTANEMLLEWRSRRAAAREVSPSRDLVTVAPLFQRAGNYDEAARSWYSVYELGAASSAEKEQALGSLISLLLDVPEQALALGRRDLSLYANIARMDPHPGFLNGILSLALNTTFPQFEYQTASQSAVTYFHRAAAAQLLERLKKEFPPSSQIPVLEAKLFGAYAAYGQTDALIRLVPAWLNRNSDSAEYVNTALALGDAYAAAKRASDEFALYDKLLATLAAKSDRVPLGPTFTGKNPQARSADYSRVLDRYISRLTAARRLTDAVALYRGEIDRNPGDPGLYQRLALFIEQNRLDAALAQTYRSAFDHFQTTTWADKLGRLYLRRKQYLAYQALAREIAGKFEGSEFAAFVRTIEPDPKLNPVLYRQINLFAHGKFPHNPVFVRNLLTAYQAKATADPVAYEKLLRENWFYDGELRRAFFELLSRSGKLNEELAQLPGVEAAAAQKNIAALQEKAEGEAWLTEFESGADSFVRLARLAPGDRAANARAISIERSLAPSIGSAFRKAISLAEQDVTAAPRDSAAVARVGEIYADRDLYTQAQPWWNRMAAINPGSLDGYREAATVSWDYFRYDDALRLIGESRRALGSQASLAYEAGAIYENKSDLSRAVEEYTKAALEQPKTGENATAESRLITLAKRKNAAPLVDGRTADLVSGPFSQPALDLRIAILSSGGRRSAIDTLLQTQISRAATVSDAEEIKRQADHFGFDQTGALALERIVALTNDPVEKIKARTDLASFRENHGDLPGAERELHALLDENPNLLGVIRQNVEFEWRNKQFGRAISTLAAAASRAQQPFGNQLRREAAGKAADAGEYSVARQLLDELLSADPNSGDYLAQKAATYAREGDKQALVGFYADTLRKLGSSTLSGGDKADRIAALRRGYIAALTTAGESSAALEQYEQVLNQYPEDQELTREAARFASKQKLADSLVRYYQKAISDSPRNYRWPLLLARIDTALGRSVDAVAAYDKAAYVRPDRPDILVAKADLQLRLLRFAEAIETNQKLYNLTYHDTRYLDEQAALNARLGNNSEAVRLLRAAHIDPHPKEPAGYVAAMRQLIAWHMFSAAQVLYGELRPLLTNGSEWAGEAVALSAQALASLHRPAEAITTVAEVWANVKGFNTDANRARYSTVIGAAAKEYLTPEEKVKFASQISGSPKLAAPFEPYDLAIAAGLLDVAADALTRKLQSRPGYEWTALNQMQSSRLKYDVLGHELELLARSTREEAMREQLLRASVDAYAKAGETAAQLRIAALSRGGPGKELVDAGQYASIFVTAHPNPVPELASLTRQNSRYADAVVQHVIANGSFPEILGAIRARGSLLPAPWTKSYSALAGLYEFSSDPVVAESFGSVLGPRTVAGELAALRAPGGQSLTGSTWFYYAARYGEYLGYRNQAQSAELLPAVLEASPAASNGYVQLGDAYRELKNLPQALSLYEDALQLSPWRADVLDRKALAQAGAGQLQEAVENWRRAFAMMADRVEAGPLPPDYWVTAESLLSHANRFRVIDELRPNAEAMLRVYIKRNGGYNLSPFVNGILRGTPDQNKALNWIVEMARLSDSVVLVTSALDLPTLTPEAKGPLYLFAVERATVRLAAAAGDARESAREQLLQLQTRYVEHLLQVNKPDEAWRVLSQIEPVGTRPVLLLLKAGARSGHLQDLLAGYRSAPETAPASEQVLAAASELAAEQYPDLALQLKEFEYGRELDAGPASVVAYFGLAEVRMAQKRQLEAEQLIQTAATSVGAPFENLPEAVRLLEKAGRREPAAQYARQWKTAEPWNPEAQLALARLEIDPAALESIRTSSAASYQTRVGAAEQMRKLQQSRAGADELALLTHPSVSSKEARQPFFAYARLQASEQSSGKLLVDLLREAIGIEPSLLAPRLALAGAAFREQLAPLGLAALESYVSPSLDQYGGLQASPAPPAELSKVKLLAADALEARQDFSGAAPYYEEALANTKTESERVRIAKLRDHAKTQAALASLNASRQPVVSEDIKQPSLVKPKLTALPSEGDE